MKLSINFFPFADNFVSWGEGFSWVELWIYYVCMYLVFVSCSYRLKGGWISLLDVSASGAAQEPCIFRLLVIAVCRLCNTNCCFMATKGCWECFSCSNGICRADHYFTACWIFFSPSVYLSVHLCLSKTTCYHWWRNRIYFE